MNRKHNISTLHSTIGGESGHALSRRRIRFSVFPILRSLLLTVAALAMGVSHAQTFYASISGLITDPRGAVVAGAAITITETTTAAEYKTVSNRLGSYRVSFLKPGTYVVQVEKSGFAKYHTSEIALVLNQEAVVDAALRLGAETQEVTVTANGTALNDTNPQIGNQLGSSDMINLPESVSSHGAEELLLASTVPGVASTSPDYSNPNNISLGGSRPDTNPIIIDGLPSNMGVNDTYGLVPTPESTEELQVLTAPFSAQYGQSGGGAILTTTKSGTKDFHGSLFYYHNDQSLNALSFFSAPNTLRPVNVFNYFGGSIGGPVLIPKVFDGRKHRLFFFTDWEDTLNAKSAVLTTDVPTTAERAGDFSGLTPQGTPNPPIYDPATSVVVNGQRQETQFPGNVIPAARLDSVAKNIISFYPAPNCNYLTYNYCVYPTGHNSYLYNADRIDYNVTDYDHIWAKFSRDGPTTGAVQYIPNAANTSALNGWRDDHDEASWSHIFGPKDLERGEIRLCIRGELQLSGYDRGGLAWTHRCPSNAVSNDFGNQPLQPRYGILFVQPRWPLHPERCGSGAGRASQPLDGWRIHGLSLQPIRSRRAFRELQLYWDLYIYYGPGGKRASRSRIRPAGHHHHQYKQHLVPAVRQIRFSLFPGRLPAHQEPDRESGSALGVRWTLLRSE